MGKPLLILCPDGYDAPLDVRDEVKPYRYPDDIVEHIAALVLELTDYLQQVEPPSGKATTSLQRLSFGDPTAENEMTTLGAYYMHTDLWGPSGPAFHQFEGQQNISRVSEGSRKLPLFNFVKSNHESRTASERNRVLDQAAAI